MPWCIPSWLISPMGISMGRSRSESHASISLISSRCEISIRNAI